MAGGDGLHGAGCPAPFVEPGAGVAPGEPGEVRRRVEAGQPPRQRNARLVEITEQHDLDELDAHTDRLRQERLEEAAGEEGGCDAAG